MEDFSQTVFGMTILSRDSILKRILLVFILSRSELFLSGKKRFSMYAAVGKWTCILAL